MTAIRNLAPLASEFLGTAFLLATVVGSGIMAETLTDDTALALLANALATGAILYVLITAFGPVSGAHFNPAVTLAMALRRRLSWPMAGGFVLVQILGAISGVVAAHLMFGLEVIQVSEKVRAGPDQWFSEAVATFGLVFFIFLAVARQGASVATVVALYITAAYWFTASTSFANPAVTIARSMTDTFSGIMPEHIPAFIGVQILAAAGAALLARVFDTSNADPAQ